MLKTRKYYDNRVKNKTYIGKNLIIGRENGKMDVFS